MSNNASPSPDRAADNGRVTDRRTTPLGVMPRHLQQWAIVATAVVMVGIMALSGRPMKPSATAAPSPATSAVNANQQRIEEYQRRIQEQTQRLAAEQAQLQRTKEAVAPSTGGSPSSPAHGEPERPPSATTATTPAERAAREERGRFADNVAFSRPSAVAASPARSETASLPASTTTATSAPALASALSSMPPVAAPPLHPETPSAPAPVEEPAPATHLAPPPTDRRSPVAASEEPRYRLFEGTLIETVLTNRLDGTFTGPVNALVSVPLYASDQQHLVIPAGSRVLGEARAVNTSGQSRLAVVFHRVILPNGTHVDLNGFHGLNQVGDLGLQDQVDRHYAQIFGVSLAIGAIAGFAQAQSTVGLDATGLDTYRQGVAANVSQSSARILDRFLNRLPTITIREGHRIKVYLSNDLELPAYRDALPATGGRP